MVRTRLVALVLAVVIALGLVPIPTQPGNPPAWAGTASCIPPPSGRSIAEYNLFMLEALERTMERDRSSGQSPNAGQLDMYYRLLDCVNSLGLRATPTPKPRPTSTPKPQPTSTPRPQPTATAKPLPSPTTKVPTKAEEKKDSTNRSGASTNQIIAANAMRQLEEAVPNLAAAQADLRKAEQRLAAFEEALSKQNLRQMQAMLADDIKEAKAERDKQYLQLVNNIPGNLYALGETLEMAKIGYGVGVSAFDIGADALPAAVKGLQDIQTKMEKGAPVTLWDYREYAGGLAKLATSLATIPGNPWNFSKGTAETVLPKLGATVLIADTVLNTGVAIASQKRYYDVGNAAASINEAALYQRRLIMEAQKAEVREKHYRDQVKRLRSLADGQ